MSNGPAHLAILPLASLNLSDPLSWLQEKLTREVIPQIRPVSAIVTTFHAIRAPVHVSHRLHSSVARVVGGAAVHFRTIRAGPARIVSGLAEAADGDIDDTLGAHAVVLHIVEGLPIKSVQGLPAVPTSVGCLAVHGTADEIFLSDTAPLLAVQLLQARRNPKDRAGSGASQRADGLAVTVPRLVDRHDPVRAAVDADLGIVHSVIFLAPLRPQLRWRAVGFAFVVVVVEAIWAPS